MPPIGATNGLRCVARYIDGNRWSRITNHEYMMIFWLVVYLPVWKIWVSWDDEKPNIWKNKKCSKPPISIYKCTLCRVPAHIESGGGIDIATRLNGSYVRRPAPRGFCSSQFHCVFGPSQIQVPKRVNLHLVNLVSESLKIETSRETILAFEEWTHKKGIWN